MRHTTHVALHALLGAALFAQAAAAQQAINLNGGFMPDPRRFAGVAGGPVSASSVDPSCRGWISAQPNFVFTTPTGFNFLRVFAVSGSDTTLMVRGVQRTICADDTYGNNPGIDLQGLPPGRYDIYVGTYAQGQAAPFQLTMSELQGTVPMGGGMNPGMNPGLQQPPPVIPNINANVNAQGSLGSLDPALRPTGRPLNIPFNPIRPVAAMGRTNGVFNARGVRGQGTCTGWMQAAPSHVMRVLTPQPFLLVAVTSAADSTLIIRRPDGSVLCADDTYGRNPGVQGNFTPGLYQVWVGSYSEGEVRPYRITVSSNPAAHP